VFVFVYEYAVADGDGGDAGRVLYPCLQWHDLTLNHLDQKSIA
jgi:hypothetical protein